MSSVFVTTHKQRIFRELKGIEKIVVGDNMESYNAFLETGLIMVLYLKLLRRVSATEVCWGYGKTYPPNSKYAETAV